MKLKKKKTKQKKGHSMIVYVSKIKKKKCP
jgi:hypothetical protein